MDLLWPPATIPPSLGAEEAHIWAVPIDDVSLPHGELRRLLSAEELARADQFRLEDPAKRFVVTRAALRVLLGHYLHNRPEEICFSTDANNKPRLASTLSATDLRFNISHSGALAIVVVTIGNEIGVDLEQLREVSYAEQIASRYFHKNEVATILSTAATERSATFLRCWTAKEAVVKAFGIGITSALDSFEVLSTEKFEGRVDLSSLDAPHSESHCWLTRLAPHRDYIAAVAVLNSRPRVLCRTFVM